MPAHPPATPTVTGALLRPAAFVVAVTTGLLLLALLTERAVEGEVLAFGLHDNAGGMVLQLTEARRLLSVQRALPLTAVVDARRRDAHVLIATGHPTAQDRAQRLYLYAPRTGALTAVYETSAPPNRAYGHEDYAVSFAPDGTRLAFVDPASGDIRLHDLATGQGRALLSDGGYMQALSWSPDGSQLATNINNALTVVDVERGQATRWSADMAGRGFVPNWSEDGRALLLNAFGSVMTGQAPPLRVIDAQTGQINRVTEALYGFNGTLGCGGQRLAYLANAARPTGQSVRVLNLQTGIEQDFSALPLLADRIIYGLRWLPDCQGLLVYALASAGGVTDTAYFFVTPDGDAAEAVTEAAWAALQDDGSMIYPQAVADGSIMLYRALPGGLRGPFGALSGQVRGLNAASGQVFTDSGVVYSQGGALWLARLDGSPPVALVSLRGRRVAFVMHWRL